MRKYQSTKTRFTITFVCCIGLPILLVFCCALVFGKFYIQNLNRKNIKLLQENMATTLQAESRNLAMKLSNLLYMNDGELLQIATIADTDDFNQRYLGQTEIFRLASYSLRPDSQVISLSFLFKSGRSTVYKAQLTLSDEQLLSLPVYQQASLQNNLIALSGINSSQSRLLYTGARNNNLLLLAVLKPESNIDRMGQIDSVFLFELSEVNDLIFKYDNDYEVRGNNIGLWAVCNSQTGEILASSRIDRQLVQDFYGGTLAPQYTAIKTACPVGDEAWDVVTIIRTSDLSRGFNYVFLVLIAVVLIIMGFFVFFLRNLLRNIINPVTRISGALKEMESGDLDQHVDAQGYVEIRQLAHSYNSMARRIKALIDEYKTKERMKGKSVQELWANMVDEYVPQADVPLARQRIFDERVRVICIRCISCEVADVTRIYKLFNTIHEFSQSCVITSNGDRELFVCYRKQRGSDESVGALVNSLHKALLDSFSLKCCSVISRDVATFEEGQQAIATLKEVGPLLALLPQGQVVNLQLDDTLWQLAQGAGKYILLANACFSFDEQQIVEQKEAILAKVMHDDMQSARREAWMVIIAVYQKFLSQNMDFDLVFGYHVDYRQQIESLDDNKALLLYINTFISSCQALVLSKIDFTSLPTIAKVKKYINDNYHKSDLSLLEVAQSVSLSEKYLSTLFTKESGESFLAYLTAVRIQNAKRLIKTTDLKMYEVAATVGYATAEHFNRTFKKHVGVSPNEYKKG